MAKFSGMFQMKNERICAKCGYEHKRYDSGIIHETKLYCRACVHKLNIKYPYLIREVATIEDMSDINIIIFKNSKDLLDNNIFDLNTDEVFMRDKNRLLAVSLKSNASRILGYIFNFAVKELCVPVYERR